MKNLKLKALCACIFFALAGHAQETATLVVNNNSDLTISRHIYGQFAEHLGRSVYDGFYRNGKIRMDIVNAMKEIKCPNLRWPGGCFADRYHWRDGIGPVDKRPLRINTDWGMVEENNSFGTAEFMRLCELIGCEPYIAGNMATGNPKEMNEWLEYLNFGGKSELSELRAQNGHPAPYKVSFWGVGNESWGCGGMMTPDFYSNLYKLYANYCDQFPGAPPLRKIASGPNGEDYNWTETFMKNVDPSQVWGLSMHYYTIPSGNFGNKGSATNFTEQEYFNTMSAALQMDRIITTQDGIMSKYDPNKQVALVVDEWGVWTNPEPGTNPAFCFQQNSLRDALVAASTLNIFNNHCDRVRMANLAQSVNVIQSVILTRGDQMLLTPTYHVFDLFKVHQDARFLPININSPDYILDGHKVTAVNASASIDLHNEIHITLTNLDPHHSIKVMTDLPGFAHLAFSSGKILTSGKVTDINTFENPNNIVPKSFDEVKLSDSKVVINLPPASVVLVTLTAASEDKVTGKAATNQDVQHLADLDNDAKTSGDYAPLANGVTSFLKQYGLLFDPQLLNSFAWDVFTGCNDKAVLNQATEWAKLVVSKTPDPAYRDTYANLLYKSGKKQEGIAEETKALNDAAAGDKPTFQLTLDKMQKGLPTW